MEISKSLQEEILAVQNKLKNAIRDHQICVGKLKDDPNNTDILAQIQKIHLHIVSLGRCQKQVVQRLRKEVETFKAENANGAKVSIASLLGLNNNNHITNNNEAKLKPVASECDTKSSKEDYEDIVRNGDVPSPTQDPVPPKQRSSSVETISGEDDVIEVSMDENSNEKGEEPEKERKDESSEKLNFLCALGLITTSRFAELQNKRAERKRRSTANPQFVYASLEVPTKRKRHSYLQSSGNAPQTRQTTARMNGPSPPPAKTAPTKSTSPPSRTVMKSLIPVQKSTSRPNILRNVTESKVFANKAKVENGPNQTQLPASTAKSVQSIGSKAVHIPGLPSSLTIERIGNDSAVCICCRNPGTLTVCENCASNYHVSCHSVSPAPPRICPKCALLDEDEGEDGEDEGDERGQGRRRRPFKKDEEIATTSHATGIIRKAREDSEIYKAACGLHKVDATQKTRGFSTALGINQLPSATFLIPISSNNVGASTVNQPEVSTASAGTSEHRENSMPYSPIVLNQLPRSSIAYVQTEPQVSYNYQLPVSSAQSDKQQSYLIVQKITEPARRKSLSSEEQGHSTVLNYQLPTTSGNSTCVQPEISVTHSTMFFDKQLPESGGRNRKKQTNRAIPALNRIVDTENLTISADYSLERATINGRKSRARQTRSKHGLNQLRSARATEILLPSYDAAEPDEQLQIAKSSDSEEASILGSRAKYKPRPSGIFHSLFAGHNKSYIVSDSPRESRDNGTGDKDHAALRQQLYHQDSQLEPNESNESTAQLQRGALTKFFEHVKLEEAHLPAPPRAKLVYKSGVPSERNELDVCESPGENRHIDEYASLTKAPLQPVTFEDGFAERNAKQSSATRISDFVSYERKHGNTYVTIECDPKKIKDNELVEAFQPEVSVLRCPDGAGPTSVYNAQSNLLELRKEVSVPDDKADTERQDLPSGRRSASTSSSESDTPEQAMHVSIEHSRMVAPNNDFGERLGIGTVSPESMQVLEQFESAMLEADHTNAATC